MKIRNKAFTLAETLVVMGIIGVIAALTVPNLSQSTGNRERVTKVQKTYATFVEALDRAQAIYGPYLEWPFTSNSTLMVGDRITEFMKLSKNCRLDSNCVLPHDFNNAMYNFQLADGTSLALFADSTTIQFFIILAKRGEKITVGKNRFRVTYKFGTTLWHSDDYDMSKLLPAVKYCITNPNGTDGDGAGLLYCVDGSLLWILRYGNMDYLKLNSSGVCPNGTTPTESNPRCN